MLARHPKRREDAEGGTYIQGGGVCVSDHDAKTKDKRLEMMQKGRGSTTAPVACGLATETIEAWTLGAPKAMASVLGLNENAVRDALPKKHVEALNPHSGVAELRPKEVVASIAGLGHREDGLRFREEVAEQTDVDELAKACPAGFGPFLEDLRDKFGSES